ncbi:MAG TPA: M23 family metallopeptidase [Anaerolineales bacterium]|nr:M23 family metallopeptidase [Anaerolineales bacterium]
MRTKRLTHCPALLTAINLIGLICFSLTGCASTNSHAPSQSDIALASNQIPAQPNQIYQPMQALAIDEHTEAINAESPELYQTNQTEGTNQASPIVVSSENEPIEAVLPVVSHQKHADSEPLRFVFPTQIADSTSLWRPPLYSVPWEPTSNDHFYFIRPIGANEINWPLANYRYGGVFFENVVHTGIDIPAPKGTPVMAAGSGTVVWAGYGLYFLREEFRDPYGLAVAIKHDFGYQGNDLYTVYGHLNEITTYQGQEVEAGDLIGYVGETGKVTGPHLHFEVRLDNNNFFGSRNPELWIAPPQGWGIIAAQVMDRSSDFLERHSVMLRNVETNRYWTVITYGKGSVNPDPFYRENMVIGDLPAGKYVIWIKYEGTIYDEIIDVLPGKVSYFRFFGSLGFDSDQPDNSQSKFIPPDAIPPKTP